MQEIVHNALIRNRNGSGSIGGRGILRRKQTSEARIALAADLATGEKQFTPSLGQSAAAAGVSPYSVRKELKARAAAAERERRAEYLRRCSPVSARASRGALPIVSAWDHATAEGRAEAIRLIGTGNVWDVLAHVVG